MMDQVVMFVLVFRTGCPKDKYCHAHFEVLELTYGEVNRRYEQSDIGMIRTIES